MDQENLNRWTEQWPLLRDGVIVAVCLGLFIYEAAFTTPDPKILGLIGTLLMSPVFARWDASRRRQRDQDETPDDDPLERWSHLP